MIQQYLFLVFLIFLSGLFSGAEVALIGLTPAKVRTLVKRNIKGAYYVAKLKQNPHRFLTTILIGNNIVNILASSYATIIFTNAYGSKGFGLAIGILTFALLLFGEILPKNFAQRYSQLCATSLARLLYIFQTVFIPLIWILEQLTRVILKAFKAPESSKMTEDELLALATIGVEEGTIDKREKELIKNILQFNDIKVEEVMISRTEIDAIEDVMTVKDTLKFMTEKSHYSRIPVYRDTIDDIYGVITVKDVLHLSRITDPKKQLRDLKLSPIFHVTAMMKINRLFREFQSRHAHLAIVTDEYGGTAGLVTIEDLLEEIVGEIQDEADIEEKMIEKIDKNSILVQGKTPIQDINEWFHVKLAAPDFKPVNYLLLEYFERFPRVGEQMEMEKLTFTVETMDGHIIKTVKVEKGK